MLDRDAAQADLRNRLIEAGRIVPQPAKGLWAFDDDFERVLEGVDALVHAMEPTTGIKRMTFPPIFDQATFVKTGYMQSFPQLIGSVDVFLGDSKGHRTMLAAKDAGEDWTTHLVPGHLNLVSAPCHQIYAMLADSTLSGPAKYEVWNRCFRHEPSDDPMRLVSFRMREKVCVGTPEQAVEHRELGMQVGPELLRSIGLQIEVVPANDPFFGRAANIFAQGQIDAGLKYEFECKVYGEHNSGTALGSSNYHNDHFGLDFQITADNGETAHSSCIGFGLERVTVALFATHGVDIREWPAEVRTRLGLA